MKATRRQFLYFTLSTPVAHAWGWGPASSLAASEAAMEWKVFDKPEIIRYDASCFTLHNQDTFLFGAEFHYPRCPRELWRDRFLKLRRAGFNTVETMVFWNYHEREQGQVDFSQFEDFLKLAQEMGFWVIVRPGPYICAEFERAGFPRWVIAEQFPLRSMHPESLKTSKYWYDHVLPIIVRNQLTNGGPIIMMQLENEYDFWRLPDPEKQEYIRFLAHLAWDAGVSVPLFTNWTRVVRDQKDFDMARIMDTCDFYPRWHFMEEVPPAILKLRKEQPAAPLGITELQGGWFAQIGGKLSVDQEGVDAAQLNALTRSALELGVTYFNYYMGYGGTNFEWAAKTLTTTYDYAAPIREPGGLWEKYYAARGVGEFVRMFGNLLARAVASERSCNCTNTDVSVSERTNAESAVLFLRANTESEHHFRVTFPDPRGATGRNFTMPREGELVLGPREMKALPVCVPLGGTRLLYTSAEILGHGVNGNRHFLVVHDQPGRLLEFAIEATQMPHAPVQSLYQYYDPEAGSLLIAARVGDEPAFIPVGEQLLLIILPTALALRTWIEKFQAGVIPGARANDVPFITDAYLLTASGGEAEKLWADIDFLPGEHQVRALLPSPPSTCRVGNVPHKLEYDPSSQTARIEISTPPLPIRPLDLKEIQTSVETFDVGTGQWIASAACPLERLGPVPYGYVKYRGEINFSNEPKLYLATFADDGKRVFINGKDVTEAANSAPMVELDARRYLQPGANTIEISCEIFGAPNGGDELGEFKGISFVRVGSQPETGASVGTWQIQAFPAALRGPSVDPEYAFSPWQPTSVGSSTSKEFVPAFTWCRAGFALPEVPNGWSVPWRLVIDADRDALIYLNGRFVGRYTTTGPQSEFYLPEPYFQPAGRKNTLTVVLAYTREGGLVRTLRVEPCAEYSAHRAHIEFQW
ncbi:MAG: beta-galactosidase [Terriglobia bacterium]